MNKDAQGRWKVGMSNTKLKMRVKPQLGRTEALAEDLKRQVELFEGGLQRDRRSVARGVNVI